MDVSCFSSTDAAARNATSLYDGDVERGELWFRDDLSTPLPPCSSISPDASSCSVCVDQIVHAVCRNLTEGVNLVMEGLGVNVHISKSDCPEFPSVDHSRKRICAYVSVILFVLFMAALLFQCCRSKKRSTRIVETDDEQAV